MDKFMDLSGGKAQKTGVSEEQKQRFLEAMKEYVKNK